MQMRRVSLEEAHPPFVRADTSQMVAAFQRAKKKAKHNPAPQSGASRATSFCNGKPLLSPEDLRFD